MTINFKELSKTISHALRHEPWLYELELDNEGWVCIEDLLSRLRTEKTEWHDLIEADIVEMIGTSSKQRHEIKAGKIRALYGHSTPQKLLKIAAEPPAFLYHGTSAEIAELILKEGLKPMQRHYVHLSVDKEMALQVGLRKSPSPIILKVNSGLAFTDGIQFYQGNDKVWLADDIPATYIAKML